MPWELGNEAFEENRAAVLTVLSAHRASLTKILREGPYSEREHELVKNCVSLALFEMDAWARKQAVDLVSGRWTTSGWQSLGVDCLAGQCPGDGG